MKKRFLLFLGIILFSITAGTQNLENKIEKPSSVPDCNLKGIPFRTYQDGAWIYDKMAGFGYALILNSIGETLNMPSSDGIYFFDKALSNPLIKNLSGYIGALSIRKDGTYCTSFSEKLSNFHGRFVCRIDSDWALYRREGCANPVLVYEPKDEHQSAPRGLAIDQVVPMIQSSVKPCCCDTTIVIINCPTITQPTAPCCEVPKLSWPLVYPMAGYRSTYDSDLRNRPMFVGFGYRKHWRDSMQMHSNYVGVEALVSLSSNINMECDTCLNFTQERDEEKLSPTVEIFVGREFGIFEKTLIRGFVEGRYALLQPQIGNVIDQRFLPKKSGLTIRGGVRYDIVKKFQLQGTYEYDPIANLSGGEVKLIFTISKNSS